MKTLRSRRLSDLLKSLLFKLRSWDLNLGTLALGSSAVLNQSFQSCCVLSPQDVFDSIFSHVGFIKFLRAFHKNLGPINTSTL